MAEDDSAITPADTPVTIDVLANDNDSDGTLDPSSVTITTQPGSGSVRVNTSTGALTYTPDEGVTGTDTLTYTVADDDGATSNAATVTILVGASDEPPLVTITAIPGDASETGPITATFILTSTTSLTVPLTITYTVDGSATPGDDYVALPGSAIMPAGATSVAITVTPVADDQNNEGSETVMVRLTPGTGYRIGSPDSATLRILDAGSDSRPGSVYLPLIQG